LLEECLPLCQELARLVAEHRGGRREDRSFELDLPLRGSRLVGTLGCLFGGRLVLYGYSSLGAKWQLDLWLRHLVLCAAGGSAKESSVRVGRDDKKRASVLKLVPLSPAVARGHLEELVALYVEGQSRPLPFLPEESFDYFERLRPAKEGAALPTPRAAIVSVASSYEREGFERDPHPQRAFDARQPPFDAKFDLGERAVEDTEFHALARRVFEPFHAAAELEVR
jgi:exodeoxyribonuclease V gamma subunit